MLLKRENVFLWINFGALIVHSHEHCTGGVLNICFLFRVGAVGGDETTDEDKEKAEEEERERQEAIKEAEDRRKEKHRKMEEEREKMRQEIRDKVGWTWFTLECRCS